MAQMGPFDLVLVLIISETLQQALIDNDHSMVNALILVLTLIGSASLMALLKTRSAKLERLIDGLPVLAIENGELRKDRMDQMRVDEDDIMSAARERQAVERLEDIQHAVVEPSGHVTVIPKQKKSQ